MCRTNLDVWVVLWYVVCVSPRREMNRIFSSTHGAFTFLFDTRESLYGGTGYLRVLVGRPIRELKIERVLCYKDFN